MVAATQEYLWIVVLGALTCFLTAFAIGANDVANTFSSSVGSKAIPLTAAICLAAVLETTGATLLGGAVTDSIRSKIIDFSYFSEQPSVLMLGMMCSLIGAGLWLFLANCFGLPVSTTHSIIGALLGFGLSSGNPQAVKWSQVGLIVGSWIVAPIAASFAGALVFLCMRTFVLRSKNSLSRAIRSLWIFIWLIALTFAIFLVFKNPFELHKACDQWVEATGSVENLAPCRIGRWADAHMGIATGIAFGISIVLTALTSVFVYKFAFRRLRLYHSRHRRDVPIPDGALSGRLNRQQHEVSTELERSGHEVQGGDNDNSVDPASNTPPQNLDFVACNLDPLEVSDLNSDYSEASKPSATFAKDSLKRKLVLLWRSMPWFKDIHAEGADEDDFVERLHTDAEVFDVETEIFFSACQVVSACMGCIAHSANDTANAIGPFAAILTIYQYGISTSVTCPWYILLFGGLAMSLGLALLGYRVIKTVGVKLVKITPARGFSMELGAAWYSWSWINGTSSKTTFAGGRREEMYAGLPSIEHQIGQLETFWRCLRLLDRDDSVLSYCQRSAFFVRCVFPPNQLYLIDM